MSLLNSAEEHGLYLDAEHQLGHFECSGDLVNFVYSREKKNTPVSMYRIHWNGTGHA
jgi:hypothetical protein